MLIDPATPLKQPAAQPPTVELDIERLPLDLSRFLFNGAALRVYAGQPDPNDPARFPIPFDLENRRGVIDGQLTDDGNGVVLRIARLAIHQEEPVLRVRMKLDVSTGNGTATIETQRHGTSSETMTMEFTGSLLNGTTQTTIRTSSVRMNASGDFARLLPKEPADFSRRRLTSQPASQPADPRR